MLLMFIILVFSNIYKKEVGFTAYIGATLFKKYATRDFIDSFYKSGPGPWGASAPDISYPSNLHMQN